MMKSIVAICILFSLLFISCSKQQESSYPHSNTNAMSDEDRAALKGAIAIDMMKKGNKEEGMKLFREAQGDWDKAQQK
jgi:hypothetical protein